MSEALGPSALVTGAGGFVGRHLVATLRSAGWRVVGVTRTAPGSAAGLELLSGDVLEDGFLRGILGSRHFDLVFHLAGLHAAAPRADLYRVNVLGATVLLDAVRALGRPGLRVVLLGSSAQYGDAKENPITEDCTNGPVSSYGASKACADMMAMVFAGETGQQVIRARAFNIVGPGQSAAFLQGSVIAQIMEAEEGRAPPVVKTGDLSACRDFVDVRDVATGLVALATNGDAGEAYNLCSGRAVRTSYLVESLVGLSRIPLSVEAGERKIAGVNVPYQRGSFEKLRRRTGWSPTLTLERSLVDALDQRRRESMGRNVAVADGAPPS